MDMTRPSFEALHIEPNRAMQRALSHCAMLRRAFHLSLSRRRDSAKWEILERAVVAVVAQTHGARRHAKWFAEADERLKSSVFALLKERSPRSSRPFHYRRAAEQVYESAANWSRELDEVTLAYWRHNALVWMTLWHMADIPDLTSTHAKERLDFCFDGKAVSPRELETHPAKEKRWRFAASLWRGA
jgi:hypothetical protein